MKMKIQVLYLTGTALLIGAAGVGDSITFDAVGSWMGAAILAVLMAAGGIVCWGYGRGLEIERAEKAQLRRPGLCGRGKAGNGQCLGRPSQLAQEGSEMNDKDFDRRLSMHILERRSKERA